MSNPSDVLLYENPMYSYPGMMPPEMNPRKKKKRRRNPNYFKGMRVASKQMFGGLDIMEILGAVGGFALCAMVPGYIIKTTETNWKKAGKMALSVGFAVASKAALQSIHAGVAKAAMYGGIAGAGALAMKIWSPSTQIINAPARGRLNAPARPVQHIGPIASTPPSMGRSTNEEFIPANQL